MGDPVHEQQREAIVAFFDRALPWFELFAVETAASPQLVQDHFLRKVAQSDVIILVLQEELKPGVRKEYIRAKELGKRVLAFVHMGEKHDNLNEFIQRDVQQYTTTVEFASTRELITKIEAALLTDVARSYRDLYEENKLLRKQLEEGRRYASAARVDDRGGGEPDWLT